MAKGKQDTNPKANENKKRIPITAYKTLEKYHGQRLPAGCYKHDNCKPKVVEAPKTITLAEYMNGVMPPQLEPKQPDKLVDTVFDLCDEIIYEENAILGWEPENNIQKVRIIGALYNNYKYRNFGYYFKKILLILINIVIATIVALGIYTVVEGDFASNFNNLLFGTLGVLVLTIVNSIFGSLFPTKGHFIRRAYFGGKASWTYTYFGSGTYGSLVGIPYYSSCKILFLYYPDVIYPVDKIAGRYCYIDKNNKDLLADEAYYFWGVARYCLRSVNTKYVVFSIGLYLVATLIWAHYLALASINNQPIVDIVVIVGILVLVWLGIIATVRTIRKNATITENCSDNFNKKAYKKAKKLSKKNGRRRVNNKKQITYDNSNYTISNDRDVKLNVIERRQGYRRWFDFSKTRYYNKLEQKAEKYLGNDGKTKKKKENNINV